MTRTRPSSVVFALLAFLLVTVGPAQSQTTPDHGWQSPQVVEGEGADRVFALALDGQDRPHLVYLGGDGLQYTWWDGDDWREPEPVGQELAGGAFPSLVIDEAGRVHLVLVVEDTVYYARRNGAGWGAPIEIERGVLPGQTALAVSGQTLHLAYQIGGGLKYAESIDGAWGAPEPVAPEVANFFFHALAVDGSGSPHLAYNHPGRRVLLYTTRTAAGWGEPQEIATGPDELTGEHNSLALDDEGRPHVSFQTADTLAYATLSGGDWETQTVDAAEGSGYHSQIVLFDGRLPGISYYDLSRAGTLNFARPLADAWDIEVVDAAGDVGEGAVMAMDSLNRPQIAYYDTGNSALKYVIWNLLPVASGEVFRVVVDAPLRGNVLSNDIDPDGFPLTANLLAGPEHGCLALSDSGRFEYLQFGGGYTGSDSFTYEACDNGGLCSAAAVSITIFVPTLISEKSTEWWAHRADGSRISLRLTGAPSATWAGVQKRNATSGQWETVKAPDGEEAWHGTADRGDERPWQQSWWVDQSLLASGPYRWAIYSGDGGYARAYSERFDMPERVGRTLVLEGTASSATLCETK